MPREGGEGRHHSWRSAAIWPRPSASHSRRTPGSDGIPIHNELAYFPFPPDTLFFYCASACAGGGETLLYDGPALLARRPRIREAFAKRVRFVAMWKPPVWQQYFGTASASEVDARLGELAPSESASFSATDRVAVLKYVAPTLKRTKWTREETFFSPILRYAAHDAYRRTMRFEDGEPLPWDVVHELCEFTNESSERIAWRAGDVVVLDNTRVLHGRLPFTGEGRVVLSRMGTLAEG